MIDPYDIPSPPTLHPPTPPPINPPPYPGLRGKNRNGQMPWKHFTMSWYEGNQRSERYLSEQTTFCVSKRGLVGFKGEKGQEMRH